jgi:AraC-like DNA-binding protein
VRIDLKIPRGRIGLVGLVASDRFQRFDPHEHPECEANLVVRGTAEILGPSGKIVITAPEMLFLPSLQPHSLLRASPDVRLWVLAWRREEAEGFPRAEPVVHRPTREEGAELARLAAGLAGVGDEAAFNAGLRYLYLRIIRGGGRAPVPDGKAAHAALYRAIEILRRESGEPGAEELGHRAGVSTPHLLRIIRAETGLTLTALRQTMRLRRFLEIQSLKPAAGLLENALEAGFGSYNQFARVFTRVFGSAPLRYYRGGGRSGSSGL